MSQPEVLELIIEGGITLISIISRIIYEIFFSFEFKEKERDIILKYLEKKYQGELKTNLIDLSKQLIEGQKFLEKLNVEIIKIFKEKKLYKRKKKVFLLGETGVGKSTLINCIEGEEFAPESKVDAPTTLEYKEYESKKYKNYIFCDTRGNEKTQASKIEKQNIEIINKNINSCDSYLFWYLKGSSNNFQNSEARFIKLIEKSLNKKIPLFFVITKSTDEEKEKERLEKAIKEYFPDRQNIPIIPIYARGTKRMPSFGLDILMEETKNFFKGLTLEEIFHIKKRDKNYQNELEEAVNNSSEKELFCFILNNMKLEELSKPMNHEEDKLIKNFIEKKYSKFIDNNLNKIIEMCILIKAKYKVININNNQQISNNLTNINNTIRENTENNLENEILEGCSTSDINRIKAKAKKYWDDYNMEVKVGVKKLLKFFIATFFESELKKQIKNNLLKINHLLD